MEIDLHFVVYESVIYIWTQFHLLKKVSNSYRNAGWCCVINFAVITIKNCFVKQDSGNACRYL